MENCQNSCAASMRETQVRVQIEFLNNAICGNESTVGELIQRLDMLTVQQEDKKKPDSNKSEPRPRLVAHAEEIKCFGERILRLTTDVRATIDHLEI